MKKEKRTMNFAEEIKSKYPNLNLQNVFKSDPTKNKKYCLWAAEQLNKGLSTVKVKNALISFNKKRAFISDKTKLNINSFKTVEELKSYLDNVKVTQKVKQCSVEESIKSKYPNLDINEIFNMDSSKGHKYSLWIAEQLNRGHNKNDIGPTVSSFITNKMRLKERDIFKYEDLKMLEDSLKDLGLSKREQKKQNFKDADEELLGEEDGFKVYRINNKKAAAKLGKGSRWCVTQDNASYFEQYSGENNVFYFLISDTDKFCVQIINKGNNKEVISEVTFWKADDTTMKNYKKYQKLVDICVKNHKENPNTLLYGIATGTVDNDIFQREFKLWAASFK
jgi:transcription antitermination factor NusA-like protein